MIKEIVDTFFELAKNHKLVRSFKYDALSKGIGDGDERMLHFFLEDPIFVNETEVTAGTSQVSINFDILGTVQIADNLPVEKPRTSFVQSLCYEVALTVIAKLREMYKNEDTLLNVLSYSFITLAHYSDNDAYGVRCTLKCTYKNEINFCDIDEHFGDGEFDATPLLPSINTDSPQSCSGNFTYKLPKIKL